MNYFPHHHPACFCFVCRGQKAGHPADRCHCDRCIRELAAAHHRYGDMPPQSVAAAEWEGVMGFVEQLHAAGYYVSPVGECEGEVWIEMEEEAVELWRQLTEVVG